MIFLKMPPKNIFFFFSHDNEELERKGSIKSATARGNYNLIKILFANQLKCWRSNNELPIRDIGIDR